MTAKPYQFQRRHGTRVERRAARALFAPLQENPDAATGPASPPASSLQAKGARGEVLSGHTERKTKSMSEQHFQEQEPEYSDGFDYIGPELRSTVSIAALCSHLCDMLWLPPELREKNGLPPTGPVEMARFYGDVTGLSEPFDLPAKDGKPRRKTVGLMGDLTIVCMPTGEFTKVGPGSVMFVPGAAHDLIVNDVRQALKTHAGGDLKLTIAYSLTAYQRSTMYNPRGHSWVGQSLQEPRRIDPHAALRQRVLGMDLNAIKAQQRLKLASPAPLPGAPLTIEGSVEVIRGDVGPLVDGDPDAIPLGQAASR